MGYKYPSLRTTLPVAGYYARLDSGASAEDQFGSAPGTLAAGTTRADNSGLCYRHSGTASGITTTYTTPIGTSDYTLSSWFNVPNINQFGLIFGKDNQNANNGYSQISTFISNAVIGGAGKRLTGLDFAFATGNVLATPTDGTYTDSAWHHVALRRRTITGTTTLSLWVDGVQITSTTATLRNFSRTDSLKIAISEASASYLLTGDTDDHLLYLVALADADVVRLASQRGAIYAQTGGTSPINGQSLIRPASAAQQQLLIQGAMS